VKKTSIRLADGRELVYFGSTPARPTDYPDLRPLAAVQVSSQQRYDPLLDEWIVVASHRRERAFLPGTDQCPLCPSTAANQTEIPAPAYDVVVFENRFPALGPPHGLRPSVEGSGDPCETPALEAAEWTDGPLLRPAVGRCEVVCFSQDHDASFADLTPEHVAIVVEAWIDRTVELSALPWVEQVYCFENRGGEVGVTLPHPHGQIYAYPFVTPRTSRMLSACAAYRQRMGKNLFDQMLAAELASGPRIVVEGEHWVALVPYASRWALEVQFYPAHRVPDLAALSEAARVEFCGLYLDVLRRFDRLFNAPVPYVSALHQAPVRQGRQEFALHIELFSIQRAPGRLQYLAGSELGMGVFATDVVAEAIAESLRQLG
jgi:UDPglucose--hexose-1-phosphate uridylyltransferase